jgi:diguanylate cyclase (GGDEF)-like protein/PAS domain S-box-containing protein
MTLGDDLFRSTFHDSPTGMAVMDGSGRILDANPALAQILGRATEAIVGRSFAEFTHPDDRPGDIEAFSHLSSGDVPHYQRQKRYLDGHGDVVWCRVTVSAVNGDDPHLPRRFVSQVEDITEFRRTKDLLDTRALHDHLTGLANHTLLIERLAEALASHAKRDTTVAVLFCDVDHFSVVNDSLGHEAGDALLAAIAGRIQSAVRPGEIVARLGGDEFVAVLENVPDVDTARDLATTVAAAVESPIRIADHDLLPTVCIGVALAEGDMTPETLVRDADTAMFVAKEEGRARIEVFRPDLRAIALNRLSIEEELRAAMSEGGLAVYYQPVVNLQTRKVEAYEALVRWEHPMRGLLMPDEFIEISEEANLVVPLGAYVLREACDLIARHPDFDGRIFVNVSTRQIGSADLTCSVESVLKATGIDARRICLEITESGMLMATGIARTDLESIAALGVDLILDDFGTGYSALSSVLQNPVAGLKLSKEFTARLGDGGSGDRISSAIATLTNSLGMYGVVEGIETEEQHRAACADGWTFGQGFLYGHPVPESELPFQPA